jgi:hypothetical protein
MIYACSLSHLTPSLCADDTKIYASSNDCADLAQPYFDYCSPLWDNCGIGLKDRLQKYQNRAARVITGAIYDIRSSELLDNLNWKPLEKDEIILNLFSSIKF